MDPVLRRLAELEQRNAEALQRLQKLDQAAAQHQGVGGGGAGARGLVPWGSSPGLWGSRGGAPIDEGDEEEGGEDDEEDDGEEAEEEEEEEEPVPRPANGARPPEPPAPPPKKAAPKKKVKKKKKKKTSAAGKPAAAAPPSSLGAGSSRATRSFASAAAAVAIAAASAAAGRPVAFTPRPSVRSAALTAARALAAAAAAERGDAKRPADDRVAAAVRAADVDALMATYDALGSSEQAWKQRFESEWEAKLDAFQRECRNVEHKMAGRHREEMGALEVRRAAGRGEQRPEPKGGKNSPSMRPSPPPLLSALQRKHAAQLRAEPRFSPQLEAMRVAQRMLLGGRKFGDAYELQEVLRAREVEEREAARKKTRAANAAALQVGGKVPD